MHKLIIPCLLLMLAPCVTASEDVSAARTTTTTLVWPDGTRYVGGVDNGKRSGKGTIFWKDGTRFVGQFENDMRNGPGTMIMPDGKVYSGVFRDDELVDATVAENTEDVALTVANEPIELEVTATPRETIVPASPQPEPVEPVVAVPVQPLQPVALKDTEQTSAQGESPEPVDDQQLDGLTDDVKDELIATIDAWGEAWSDQDVTEYLASYSQEFVVPGNLSRRGWEALRRSRLTRPKQISVDIVYQKFEMAPQSTAEVQFRQTYRSDLYRDVTTKHLRLRRESPTWKIIQETSP